MEAIEDLVARRDAGKRDGAFESFSGCNSLSRTMPQANCAGAVLIHARRMIERKERLVFQQNRIALSAFCTPALPSKAF